MSGAAAPPAAGSSAAAPAPTGTADAAAEARASLRASRIIGSNIYNEQNESVGGVDDLMLRGEGGPVVVIISVGGFLGIGARNVAVPFTELRYDSERDRWVLPGATREALQERPAFAYETTRAGAPATGTASPPGAAGGGGPAPTQRQ
jgi:sporulation protein YlmC with PRC-barrel domain